MGKKDEFFETLETSTPGLRRYARALFAGVGPTTADEFVHSAIQNLAAQLRAREVRAANEGDARVRLFRVLTDLAARKMRSGVGPRPSARYPAIVHGLADLPFDERATLLLVVLEGFGYDDAARIMGATRETTVARLMRARGVLSGLDLRPRAAPDGPHRTSSHLRVVK